jgi:hypothetical protein
MLKKFALFCLLSALFMLTSCSKKSSSAEPSNHSSERPAEVKPVAPSATQPPAAVNFRPAGPIVFTDIAEQAGIHFKYNNGAFGKKYLPETMGAGICFIDYDNDGWQDILLVNSMDWPGHKSGRSTPALYHNNKDGTFTDVTQTAGLAIEVYGLGCTIGDYDNDGYDDIGSLTSPQERV